MVNQNQENLFKLKTTTSLRFRVSELNRTYINSTSHQLWRTWTNPHGEYLDIDRCISSSISRGLHTFIVEKRNTKIWRKPFISHQSARLCGAEWGEMRKQFPLSSIIIHFTPRRRGDWCEMKGVSSKMLVRISLIKVFAPPPPRYRR